MDPVAFYRDGTTHVVFAPLDFMAWLAALTSCRASPTSTSRTLVGRALVKLNPLPERTCWIGRVTTSSSAESISAAAVRFQKPT